MQTEKLIIVVLMIAGGVTGAPAKAQVIPLPHFEYVMNATPAPLSWSEKIIGSCIQKTRLVHPDDVHALNRAKTALAIKKQEKELLVRHQDLLVQTQGILIPLDQDTKHELDERLKKNKESLEQNSKEIAQLKNNTIPLLYRRATTLVRARSAAINQEK